MRSTSGVSIIRIDKQYTHLDFNSNGADGIQNYGMSALPLQNGLTVLTAKYEMQSRKQSNPVHNWAQ